MAVYKKDDPLLFRDALESIYENTLQPEMFVLVVDGPVDDSIKIVISNYQKKFSHRMKVCWLPTNKGLANALNEGLKLIETQYVARADADDINYLNRFEEQFKFMEQGYDLFGSAIQEVDRIGNPLSIRMPPINHEVIKLFLKRRNPFNHMTVFFRTDLAKSCGGYPELDLREDYGLWARMIQNGARCVNADSILVNATTGEEFYRRRGGIRSVKAEIALQKFLVMLLIKNRFESLLEIVLKSIIFMAPSSIRAFLYKTCLRQKSY